jgi:hypothetical protein
MIEVKIKDAQRELPTLAAKALDGEDVVITVGKKKLRLTRAEQNGAIDTGSGPRPGRGAWKDRITIPDAFYTPWSAEEMGESED